MFKSGHIWQCLKMGDIPVEITRRLAGSKWQGLSHRSAIYNGDIKTSADVYVLSIFGSCGYESKDVKSLASWFSHLSSGRWQVVMEFPCSPRSQRLWKVGFASQHLVNHVSSSFFLQNGINVANFTGDPPCFNQPLGNMMGHLSKHGKCCTWCVPSKAKASTKPVSLSHLL